MKVQPQVQRYILRITEAPTRLVTVEVEKPPKLIIQPGSIIFNGGGGGTSIDVVREADENISSGFVVSTIGSNGHVVVASRDNPQRAFAVLGVSVNSPLAGDNTPVRLNGPLTRSGWTLQPGKPVFLGLGGAITQTPPVNGVQVCIGVAMDLHTINIQIGAPIVLEG